MAEDPEQLTGEEVISSILEALDKMDDFLEGMNRRTCLEGQQETQEIRELISRYGGIAEAVAGEIQNISDRKLYDLVNIALITDSMLLYESVWKEVKRRGLMEGKCETI